MSDIALDAYGRVTIANGITVPMSEVTLDHGDPPIKPGSVIRYQGNLYTVTVVSADGASLAAIAATE